MGNFLKLKLGIALFSISILVLIPLLKSNFNAPVTIKRWGKLSWDDFQGFTVPFSGYAAAISSTVYLEFDSASSKFHAYAGQHNIQSWKRSKLNSPNYSLNHEQYHFNITELHARIFNEYIDANPNESEHFYQLRLQSIQTDLRIMQNAYDDETDHALLEDKQRRWEYKIDSLLLTHSPDSGWVTDYYSGAKIYFPSSPQFASGTDDNFMFRSFRLSKYRMSLSLISFQYEMMDVGSLENNLRQFYNDHGTEIKYLTTDYSQYPFKGTVLVTDSLGNAYRSIWIYNDAYLFKLTASYPNDGTDSWGYTEIANSFLNSFKIENTDSHWITQWKNSTAPVTHNKVARGGKKMPSGTFCYIFAETKPYGFFRGPIYTEEGGLLLAYDAVEHADSLISTNTLLINRDAYYSKSKSEDHLYFVPQKRLPNNIYGMSFGYLLKQDSAKACYSFYSQWLEINPEKRNANALMTNTVD
jgi:hypothetical protein